jgi:hypothetical protein
MDRRLEEAKELDDLFVESVSDDGELVLRLPGGSALRLLIPRELIRYYRRLIPAELVPAPG